MRAKTKAESTLRGALTFHSETGTEGGFWSFLDDRYTSYRTPIPKELLPGVKVFDAVNQRRRGRVRQTWKADGRPLPDPTLDDKLKELIADMEREGGSVMDSFPEYIRRADQLDVYRVDPDEDIRVQVEWVDGVTEDRLASSLLTQSAEYQGLHCLGNGDRLTIFELKDPSRILWRGVIRLKQHPLFTETVFGMWIHADMKGWNREEWAKLFLEEYPAELIPRRR